MFAGRLFQVFFAAVLFSACVATAKDYPDPARFDGAIKKFETADAKAKPAEGGIVCVGSSSMRMWKTIKDDLTPLPVVHRGFGGSNYNDVLHHAERVILAYKPRAILIYEGDNDTNLGIPVEQILGVFDKLMAKLHAELPELRVYVLPGKPSIKRWEKWPAYIELNSALKTKCETDKRLTYVDIAAVMLKEDGTPKPDIFIKDDLHMNAEGYKLWTSVVRPILLKGESGK
jgi:lysophospholipase L1-like esterase